METKKKLTKDQEVELAWNWHINPSLALVYRTFKNYIAVYTNNKSVSEEKCS